MSSRGVAEMKSLPDYPCRPGGVLIVGINPSPVSVELGRYYQGKHGKRLWKRLTRVGLLNGACEGREDEAFVAAGNGLTDLVKRATASADELSSDEIATGVAGLRSKVRSWRPGLMLFVYRPPAAHLLGGANVRPGACPMFEGIHTFLLSSPYAKSADTIRVDGELRDALALLGKHR